MWETIFVHHISVDDEFAHFRMNRSVRHTYMIPICTSAKHHMAPLKNNLEDLGMCFSCWILSWGMLHVSSGENLYIYKYILYIYVYFNSRVLLHFFRALFRDHRFCFRR